MERSLPATAQTRAQTTHSSCTPDGDVGAQQQVACHTVLKAQGVKVCRGVQVIGHRQPHSQLPRAQAVLLRHTQRHRLHRQRQGRGGRKGA